MAFAHGGLGQIAVKLPCYSFRTVRRGILLGVAVFWSFPTKVYQRHHGEL